jgi:hypothetical protein
VTEEDGILAEIRKITGLSSNKPKYVYHYSNFKAIESIIQNNSP